MMKVSRFSEELEHIPEGHTHPQYLFRLMYQVHRMHCLNEGPSEQARRRTLIESCSTIMKEAFPGFEPSYDEKYFLVTLSE
jgi:hypothetical protein